MTDRVILVPLDGSRNAHCALPIAMRVAGVGKGPRKAHIRILRVGEETAPLGAVTDALGLEPGDLAGCSIKVRAGNPAEATLKEAADSGAGLIIVCAPSAGARPVDAISDVALSVLGRSRCPVILVNPAAAPRDGTFKRVLALHDGSPAVSDALGPAAELAREAGAELIVLQVAGGECAEEAGSIPPPVYLDQVQHSWPAWSAEFLHRLGIVCSLADVPVRLLLGHGEPGEETVRAARAERADLIVLEWTGDWDAPEASTLKALLRDAPCPVMVTRARSVGEG